MGTGKATVSQESLYLFLKVEFYAFEIKKSAREEDLALNSYFLMVKRQMGRKQKSVKRCGFLFKCSNCSMIFFLCSFDKMDLAHNFHSKIIVQNHKRVITKVNTLKPQCYKVDASEKCVPYWTIFIIS